MKYIYGHAFSKFFSSTFSAWGWDMWLNKLMFLFTVTHLVGVTFILKSGMTFVTFPLKSRGWCIIELFTLTSTETQGRFPLLVFHYDTHCSTPGVLSYACVVDYNWWKVLYCQPSPYSSTWTCWQIVAVSPAKLVSSDGNISLRRCVLFVVRIQFKEVTRLSYI